MSSWTKVKRTVVDSVTQEEVVIHGEALQGVGEVIGVAKDGDAVISQGKVYSNLPSNYFIKEPPFDFPYVVTQAEFEANFELDT